MEWGVFPAPTQRTHQAFPTLSTHLALIRGQFAPSEVIGTLQIYKRVQCCHLNWCVLPQDFLVMFVQ